MFMQGCTVLFLLAIISLTQGAVIPPEKDTDGRIEWFWDPEQKGGGIEGDMIPTDIVPTFRSISNREGILWPKGIVPFKFSEKGHFTKEERKNVTKAMKNIEEASCIKYIPQTDEKSYLFIANGLGCSSNVGMTRPYRKRTGQYLILGLGCFPVGKIMHELMHALGFYHEQMRWDRDDYIKINHENIAQGKMGNFRIYGEEKSRTDLNMPYDYNSIMHYPRMSFPANLGLETLIPIQPGAEIGQRRGLSVVDRYKLNKLYQCPGKVVELNQDYFTTPTPPIVENEMPSIILKEMYRCSFDFDWTCDFKDDIHSDFDWKLNKGSTLTTDTGPDDDVSKGGGYMYTEVSGRKIGQLARLSTPFFAAAPDGICLRFYYHMSGVEIGKLVVSIRDVAGNVNNLLTVEGDQGNEWHKYHQMINIDNTFEIVFESTVGDYKYFSGKGDMAIDDVVVFFKSEMGSIIC